MQQKNNLIYGCLFGQAIGDALGLGTEFMSKAELANKLPDRVNRIPSNYKRLSSKYVSTGCLER